MYNYSDRITLASGILARLLTSDIYSHGKYREWALRMMLSRFFLPEDEDGGHNRTAQNSTEHGRDVEDDLRME